MSYSIVRIRNSPNFYVQWFEDGRSHRCSTGTRDPKEAKAFLRAFELERERLPSGPIELRQILDLYIEARRDEMISIDRAELAVRHLKAFYGAILVDDAGPSMQDRYILHRRAAGVKDETIRREQNVMSAALKHAVKREKIDRAPPVIQPKKSEPKERWLSRDEAASILNRFRTGATPKGEKEAKGAREKTRHLMLFTRLALFTGARTGAILDLTWDRVDFKQGKIWYPVPGVAQNNKKRTVPNVEPNIIAALAAAKRRNEKSKWKNDYVISWRGEKCERIVRAFRNHMSEMGLEDVTPHTLRHTFATWAARKGVPLHHIGAALGQSTVSITERYAKHMPDTFRDVMRAARRK